MFRFNFSTLFFSLTLALLSVSIYADSSFTYLHKIMASDANTSDYFGDTNTIDIYENTVVIGAERKDYNSSIPNSGAAYVFEYNSTSNTFNQVAKLTMDIPIEDARFGSSVAIYNDTIAIGAHHINTSRGAAYVFAKPLGGWQDMNQTAKLTASDAANYDYMGNDIAIFQDTIAVGIPQIKEAVYIFEKNGALWVDANESAKLTARNHTAYSWLGSSIALNETTVVAGASADNADTGVVFVYEKSGVDWSDANETARFSTTTPHQYDRFGNSVALSKDAIAAGAFYYPNNAQDGISYIFEKNGASWSDANETARLTVTNPEYKDKRAGKVVCMIGDILLSSSNEEVRIFEKQSPHWLDSNESRTLKDGSIPNNIYFGSALGCNSSWVIVGAYLEDSYTGAAYIFKANIRQDNGFQPAVIHYLLD